MQNKSNICPNCGSENNRYAIVCISCKAYLQNRVVNLDLFHTIWKMIENPGEAFRLVRLAEHKNYVMLLFILCGINFAFILMSAYKLGDSLGNILYIVIACILLGSVAGMAGGTFLSVFHMVISKLFGENASFKTSLGVLGYASIPSTISLVMIIPIKLALFGIYLFTFNPSPAVIKPLPYFILTSIDFLMVIWNYFLLIYGTNLSCQISVWKSIITATILYILLGTGFIFFENLIPVMLKALGAGS
jgi:hypothetical protein